MVNLARNTRSPSLHIARVPGELGPVVRCSGELTVATGESLKRELDLLTSLGHPALLLNVTGCSFIDVDGVLLVIDTYKQLREQGRCFAIVAGREAAAGVFQVLGIDWILPVFPTEASAALALRDGELPPEAPSTWLKARAESLAMWRTILEALKEEAADRVMRRITSMHGLCRRAEEIADGRSVSTRCYVCPLFQVLGARADDVGCRSVTQPMLEALLMGERDAARARISRLIDLIERMPLPHE